VTQVADSLAFLGRSGIAFVRPIRRKTGTIRHVTDARFSAAKHVDEARAALASL
jgi:hypothetical protein